MCDQRFSSPPICVIPYKPGLIGAFPFPLSPILYHLDGLTTRIDGNKLANTQRTMGMLSTRCETRMTGKWEAKTHAMNNKGAALLTPHGSERQVSPTVGNLFLFLVESFQQQTTCIAEISSEE